MFLFHCAASLACSATCIKSVLGLLQSMRLVDLRERWLLTLNMPGADARRCNIYAERERKSREGGERGADNRRVDSQWRLTALKRAALAVAGRVAAW